MLSFSFILTIIPANISNVSPKDETIKIKLNLSPANKPRAPIISNITIAKPIFSMPNRLNSFFMCGALK